ncbi:hypothetical protein [Mycobacterium sp. SA01]|uniref:hypothetical protein n=1 Tax=Mycobacterium sp. SA01 TaxID=3238820 RepID=UPI00351AB822
MTDAKTPSWFEIAERLLLAANAELGYSLLTGMPPNPVSLVTTFGDAMAERRRGRGQEFLQPIVEVVGADRLLAKIEGDPALESLLWNGLQGAMATALEEKRICLARVVATALTDDDKVDEAQLLVSALQELEGPHIAALTRLRKADDENQHNPGVNDEILNSALRSELAPVLAHLLRAGVVFFGSVQGRDGLYRIPDPRTYGITGVNEFGRRILKDLESIAVE